MVAAMTWKSGVFYQPGQVARFNVYFFQLFYVYVVQKALFLARYVAKNVVFSLPQKIELFSLYHLEKTRDVLKLL